MILYSDKDDHYSHRVRIVLAEKDIACEIRETSNEEAPEEVLALNPYHTLPILADRDLGLYDAGVMLEYLDERFPSSTPSSSISSLKGQQSNSYVKNR
jgi:RNA polymerase-associated protein